MTKLNQSCKHKCIDYKARLKAFCIYVIIFFLHCKHRDVWSLAYANWRHSWMFDKSDLIRRHTPRHRRRCSHNRCRPQFALKPCSLYRDSQKQYLIITLSVGSCRLLHLYKKLIIINSNNYNVKCHKLCNLSNRSVLPQSLTSLNGWTFFRDYSNPQAANFLTFVIVAYKHVVYVVSGRTAFWRFVV